MTDKLIIAIVGVRESGKAIAASYLARERGFTMLNMATPVEMMLSAGLGLDPSVWAHDVQREPLEGAGGCSPADLKNSLFHDWGRRSVHPSIWAKSWTRLVDRSAAPRLVVKDAAFPVEIEEVRAKGGIVWRVEREGYGPRSMADEAAMALKVDLVIQNRGDMATMARMLDLGLRAAGGL